MASFARLLTIGTSTTSGRIPAMTTARLHLRPFEKADAPRVAALAGDWGIASMTARIPYPYTEADAVEWLAAIDDAEPVAAITHDGQLIGAIGYKPTPDRRSAEVGYWLGRPYWGHGYMTEAGRAVLRHCFERERFPHLSCGHISDNPRSARVIEKLGFKPTGEICTGWCEARRIEVEIVRYDLTAPQRLPWPLARSARR